MKRTRRNLLKLLLLWPLSLAAARLLGPEYVVIDGWVMKRSDVQARPRRPSSR